MGLVPYSPLGRGMLGGAVGRTEQIPDDDWRRQQPRFAAGNVEPNLALVASLERIAHRLGVSVSQVALAWLLHQGDDIVPIPGTKHRKYLEENVAALEIKLTAKDLQRIDEIFPTGAAAGLRYPEHMMSTVNG